MLEEDADVDDVEDASKEWDDNENVFFVVLVLRPFLVFRSLLSLAWSVRSPPPPPEGDSRRDNEQDKENKGLAWRRGGEGLHQ